MTQKERAAMQQALEALEELHYSSGTVVAARKYELATAALREALAEQAEQEPVGMVIGGVFEPWNDDVLSGAWEIYAAPVSIEAAVLAEREACAKVCEENGKEPDDHKTYEGYDEGYQDGSNNCAAAIRERSNANARARGK